MPFTPQPRGEASAPILLQRGAAALGAGRLEEAVAHYRAALVLLPRAPLACLGLGIALRRLGRLDEAEAVLRQVLKLVPQQPEAWRELAVVLRKRGQPAQAVEACRAAIAAGVAGAAIQSNLGHALAQLGRFGPAAAAFQAALRTSPGNADLAANLGAALLALGRYHEAAAASAAAIRLRPQHANALANFGYALSGLNRHEEAVTACAAAIQLQPGHANAHANLGLALIGLARFDEAIAAFDEALAIAPDHREAGEARAMALLVLGRFEEGWRAYAGRRRPPLDLGAAHGGRWQGEPLEGRTLLLYAEQGLGDTIQLVRYIPSLARGGARILLLVPPALRRLLLSLPGVKQVLTSVKDLPGFDLHASLFDLPGILGTRHDTIPAGVPYLEPEREMAEEWRRRLAPLPASRRVGIAWAGNPAHRNDGSRSIAFDALAPLWRIPDVAWVSLQVGPRAADLRSLPEGVQVEDLAPALHDLAETAAAMRGLDLVVTVDTAVAHLAGALGLPAWVMLPYVPDWRWMLGREDTPWYPTLRLLRQPRAQDWASVVARVASALAGEDAPMAHRLSRA